MLDELPHASLRDPAAAEELHGVGRGLLGAPRAVRLEERDLARELRRLLLVRLHGRGSAESGDRGWAQGGLTMLHIWYVMLSSQLCTLSVREIMPASLLRMTVSEWRGLPNALRWLTHLLQDSSASVYSWYSVEAITKTHFMHSSTTSRWERADVQQSTQRS